MTKLSLEIGKEYLLNVDYEKSKKGRYIGFNPVSTNLWFKLEQPEGNVFAVLNDEKVEIYCDRAKTRGTAQLLWHCDGEDDPCWPAGIGVEKPDFQLRGNEESYLLNLIKKQGVRAA